MSTVEEAKRDRILRLIGRALIEISWDRPATAADSLVEATHLLREMARTLDEQAGQG